MKIIHECKTPARESIEKHGVVKFNDAIKTHRFFHGSKKHEHEELKLRLPRNKKLRSGRWGKKVKSIGA